MLPRCMRVVPLAFAGLVAFYFSNSVARAEDPFSAAIRPTDAKSPEDERRSFRVPPGFEVQLVAAEPEIQKPMNLAFDARGRLWVSGSTEYPFPAPADRPGRDSIRILEDRNGDGRADKVTVFADGLNIPIGLYPYKDGAIAFSIPFIYDLQDTDGDGRADHREALYGPLGFDRDTHGMNNAFRRGFDGWMYANHGWQNHSTIKGKDGSRIDIEGGNTYRLRADGSRVEWFTHGQVNPFGMAFNPMGDLFNADCHTRPIMLLLRGGYYDSFGKPHNGLGYVPPVMEHSHGSTAIAGTTCYTGTNFPVEYRGNMFVGNVMTSRVNRDAIEYSGSSPRAIEQPDFLASDDPWFRPVDLQVGPDGALYIADFYNKIIGHVEVPLNHPGRDHVRGRIWRVVYKGNGRDQTALSASPDLRAAGVTELIAAFDHPVLGVRMRAGDELADRIGPAAVGPLRAAFRGGSPTARAHALWALYRLDSLRAHDLSAAASDADQLVRTHAMRVLAETPRWDDALRSLAVRGLVDRDPFVERAATDAIGKHPRQADVALLVELWQRTSESDVHLRHSVRLALLEMIKLPGTLARWAATGPSEEAFALLSGVALALPNDEAGAFLIDRLRRHRVKSELMGPLLTHAAKHLPKDVDVSALAEIAQKGVAGDLDLQLDLLMAVRQGLQNRSQAVPASIKDWGTNLTRQLLASVAGGETDWAAFDRDGMPGRPWRIEARKSADGAEPLPFLSSLPLGETYTGMVRSREFAIPPRLSLFICGHLGYPDQPASPVNKVRIRIAETDQVVAEALAPRNDVAQGVSWDMRAYAGKRGVIEVIDGLDLDSYAWVAVARIDPPVAVVPKLDPEVVGRRTIAAAQLAEAFGLRELEPAVRVIVLNKLAEPSVRAAAARTLTSFHADPRRSALIRIVADPKLSVGIREAILTDAASGDRPASKELVGKVARELPARLQASLAESLAETSDGADLLLTLIEAGSLAASHLQSAAIQAKLRSHGDGRFAAAVGKLTSALPPIEEKTRQLIAARSQGFVSARADAARGRLVFEKNCAGCHQIGGRGALVGPQLDGEGLRGSERVLEDILDPNRNVDPAFHATLLALRDGRVISGLVRREEGANLILVDRNGKETPIPSAEVEERKLTRLSPMPADFGVVLAEPDLYDLVAFLLAEARKAAAPVSR
jgi:putative heme-binding domain-containing protein